MIFTHAKGFSFLGYMMAKTFEANTGKFNAQIKKLQNLVPEMARDTLRKIAFDTYGELIKRTPRDTGRARGGWNNVVDTSPSEWKPSKGKSVYQLQQFKGYNQIKHSSTINISNNVEYIKPLDDGHSKQAPTGITGFVLAKMKTQLNNVIASLNRRKIK